MANEILTGQNNERADLPEYEARAHQERLRAEREKAAERLSDKSERGAESARQEIEQITAEQEPGKHEAPAEKQVERTINSKVARKKAYNSIMSQTRAEMSAPERAFSQVIHNPVVERVSEVAGNTIARPDAILSGAIFAFALTLVIYLVAKQSGYPLTGTEAIAAFIIGWVVGNIFDFAKALFRGR